MSKEPLLCKKLYLLAALEVEQHKDKLFRPAPDGTQQTVQTTLTSLITQDQTAMTNAAMDKPWRGVEGCHFYILAQRFLYEQREDLAMCCAMRCTEYEDVLDPLSVYSLLALAAYYNQFNHLCSKAFLRLENAADIPVEQRKKFSTLAVQIFARTMPKDPSARVEACPKCQQSVQEWQPSCPHCFHKLAACVVTGRPIFSGPTSGDTGACRHCRRRFYMSEVGRLQHCPLCHHKLPPPGEIAGVGRSLSKEAPLRSLSKEAPR